MNATPGDQDNLAAGRQRPVESWFRMSEVLHAFEPGEHNQAAFVHALRLAAASGARLSLMCLRGSEAAVDEDRLSRARQLLQRWNTLSTSSGPACESEQNLRLRMLQVAGHDPVKACVRFLQDNPTDLIVLTAPRPEDRGSWFNAPSSEALTRKTGEMSLLIPPDVQGFVSGADGSVSLRHLLIPMAAAPRPEPAIEAARRIMLSMPQQQGTAFLLHVGDGSTLPDVSPPAVPGWTWQTLCRQGDVAGTILEVAAALPADLIVMTTFGKYNFLDALRGTVSRQIVNRSGRPLLALPEGSFLG